MYVKYCFQIAYIYIPQLRTFFRKTNFIVDVKKSFLKIYLLPWAESRSNILAPEIQNMVSLKANSFYFSLYF